MSRRDWIRVRSRWWEDPDLDNLTAAERRWGPFLMYLADSDPDWEETGIAWLLRATGGPMSGKDLAKLGQEKGNRVAKLLGKLEANGVLIRRDDGAFGFRNYRKHQEDPSTDRKRKKRKTQETHRKFTADEAGNSREKQKQKQKVEAEEIMGAVDNSGECGESAQDPQESSPPSPHISQSSQEPPQDVQPPGDSSTAPASENGTRAGSGALTPLGGLRAELDARRKELADRAATLPIVDGPRPRPANPEDKLGAVAQGLRHELDAMRRQVMADTGVHLGPLSRKGSETLDGITAALEDHEPAEILEIARWRAEQVVAGTSAQVLWVCLFHGNGFSLTVRERLDAKDGGKRWRPWADIESELRDNAKRYGWEASKLEHELDDAREFYERRESL